MSELEKHIQRNRKALDEVEVPNVDKIWAGIEAVVEPKRKRPFVPYFRRVAIAASFMFLGGVAVWLYIGRGGDVTPPNIADYYPGLKQKEQAYRQQVARQAALIPFDSLDRQLYGEILDELKELDEMQQQRLRDLPRYAKNERLVDGLMQYYERKLQILERILQEYKKRKRDEKREEIQL